ncbi:ankyrin repeat domain-containing protein [Candidatus Dependentiae bacterium]
MFKLHKILLITMFYFLTIGKQSNCMYTKYKYGTDFYFSTRYAIEQGDLNEIKKLIKELKWPVDAIIDKNETLLQIACKHHNFKIIKFLVDNSASVNLSFSDGKKTALHIVCENTLNGKYHNFEIIKFLVDNGADVNKLDSRGSTPFSIVCNNHNIVARNFLMVIEYFLEKGADINRRSFRGWTSLAFACWKGNLGLVKYLVERGANIEQSRLSFSKEVKNYLKLVKEYNALSSNQKNSNQKRLVFIKQKKDKNKEDFKNLIRLTLSQAIRDKTGKKMGFFKKLYKHFCKKQKHKEFAEIFSEKKSFYLKIHFKKVCHEMNFLKKLSEVANNNYIDLIIKTKIN